MGSTSALALFATPQRKVQAVYSFRGVFCVLAHFGHYHRHVFPTRKEDDNALLHRDIANMKREVALYYCSTRGITNLTYDVAHSTPLGRQKTELLLLSAGGAPSIPKSQTQR